MRDGSECELAVWNKSLLIKWGTKAVRCGAGVCGQQNVEHDLRDTYTYVCMHSCNAHTNVVVVVILEAGVVSLGGRWRTCLSSVHLLKQEVC